MTAKINREQYDYLHSLAYWVAEGAYIRERFGDNDPDLEDCHKTVLLCFDNLDKLGVPFWVQNTVLAWADDWRREQSEYLTEFLKSKNIFVED